MSMVMRLARHPAAISVLIAASLTSFLLWMPFGLGYYDFPWGNPHAVGLLATFVFTFPIACSLSSIGSLSPRFMPVRFVMSLPALLVSLHGVLHMLHWWLVAVPQYLGK